MSDFAVPGYLSGLGLDQARALMRVNGPGLNDLRRYLVAQNAVAFLGAGASAPLYPSWPGLIGELVDAAAHRISEAEATTCRGLAEQAPEEVVEILRRQLGPPEFREALRDAFRVRTDPLSGRTWTPTHELVCRCAFKAIVTTNYDPGIVDARNRVRPNAIGTGFSSWTDEGALDRWRTGDVFGDGELPVLFAHGQHNQPEAMVLASTEYRRAYAGKLSRVLAAIVDTGHLVWIGFSFADQRIAAILREVAQTSDRRTDPGAAPRHVAILPWDPQAAINDPGVLAQRAEIAYGVKVVFYPAPNGDYTALTVLLADLVDPRFPAVPALSDPSASNAVESADPFDIPALWMPPADPVPHFTGRAEELARLSRWAADPVVRLVGVTAWGGAGKTALVTEWLRRLGSAAGREGVQGMFAWSFYADASAEHWATSLLRWAADTLGVLMIGRARLGAAVLALLEAVPLVLVLDGLEMVQEGPGGGGFGRLLDGTLREALTGACQVPHRGLLVMTSRFPFADLEGFDGGTARMLDVPPFTRAEGAELLAAAGGGWLPESERRDLVAGVDGHALAVAALGAALADRPPTTDLAGLRAALSAAASTNVRVAKVLNFYASQLTEADRYLVAAVALFARPVTPDAVLTVARHGVFGGCLDKWTPSVVEAAARDRLAGLLSWHPDGTLAAHPLVRDAFRPLALGAAEVAAKTTLTGVPAGTITTRGEALRLVEAIELLVAADQWSAADDLYYRRTDNGQVWRSLPAARLGLRAASAFVATVDRRNVCAGRLNGRKLGYYLNAVGLHASIGGDLATAGEYLNAAIAHDRTATGSDPAIKLRNLSGCLCHLGAIDAARQAAEESAAAAARTSRTAVGMAAAHMGWVLTLAGDIPGAEEQFLIADRIYHADKGRHLSSLGGIRWAEFLALTGRIESARRLAKFNLSVSLRNHWNEDVARCNRLLGSLELAAGDPDAAGQKAAAAAVTFRDGDYLVELAYTLSILADCVRLSGDLDRAELHVAEALTLAGPRGLVSAQAAALTVRANTYADRVAAGDSTDLDRARDAAETAYRLALRHRLAWNELDAVETHTRLDAIAGNDRGWATRAAVLRARFIPAGLDPDPPSTVEQSGSK